MRLRTVICICLIALQCDVLARAQWTNSAPIAGRAGAVVPGLDGVDPVRPALFPSGRIRLGAGWHVPFGVRALTTSSFRAGVSWVDWSVDAGADHREYGDYSAERMHGSVGRMVGQFGAIHVRTGISVALIHEKLGRLGDRYRPMVHAGVVLRHMSGISVAAHAGDAGIRMDTSILFRNPYPAVAVSAVLDPVYGWSGAVGLEWALVHRVTARLGYAPLLEKMGVGLGLRLPGSLRVEWAMSSTPGPGRSTWLELSAVR